MQPFRKIRQRTSLLPKFRKKEFFMLKTYNKTNIFAFYFCLAAMGCVLPDIANSQERRENNYSLKNGMMTERNVYSVTNLAPPQESDPEILKTMWDISLFTFDSAFDGTSKYIWAGTMLKGVIWATSEAEVMVNVLYDNRGESIGMNLPVVIDPTILLNVKTTVLDTHVSSSWMATGINYSIMTIIRPRGC